MTRLVFLVEGQSEESFVNELLGPHLVAHWAAHGRTSSTYAASRVGTFRAGKTRERGGLRILHRIPDYQKLVATRVLNDIGISTLRSACPHFGAWLTCLESLGGPTPQPWPIRVQRHSAG